MKYYILLSSSILFEVIGVLFLNKANGFTILLPSLLAVFFYCLSIITYILLTTNKEVGAINAVFAGIGTACVTICGVVFFHESVSVLKVIGIGLIIYGAVSISLKDKTNKEVKV